MSGQPPAVVGCDILPDLAANGPGGLTDRPVSLLCSHRLRLISTISLWKYYLYLKM